MYVRRRGLGASPLAVQLSSAISRQENTNPTYNNPCGLTKGAGQTGTAGNGIAIFSDQATGLTACQNLIDTYVGQGDTLQEMINCWAPSSTSVCPQHPNAGPCGAMCAGNDPAAYASNVASWAQIDPTIPLNSLASAVGTGTGGSWDIGVTQAGVFDLSSVDWGVVGPVLLIGGLVILVLSKI